jgi:hypothetical protein
VADVRSTGPSDASDVVIDPAADPGNQLADWSTRLRTLAKRVAMFVSARELMIGGIIGILTWPIASAGPRIGLDPSWIAALHLAAKQELLFGHDVMFTYGPLGFLGWPDPYFAWTSAAALVFVAAIHFTACLTLLHLARQSLGLPRATLFVFLTAFTFPWIAGWRFYGILLFVAVATALYRRAERPSGAPFAVAIGIAVGVAGLGKLNVAIVGMVIATIGVASTSRRPVRSVVIFLAATAATFLFLWGMTGQHLSDVPTYLLAAIDLSVGYSQSMGAVDPQTEWTSGVALLVTLILLGMFWVRTSGLPRRDRGVLTALVSITILAEYKAGFTRAGVGVTIYLATLLALWPVVVPTMRSWAAATVPLAGMFAAFLAIGAFPVWDLVDPIGRAGALETQVTTALFHRGDAARATAASLREQYALTPEAVALLKGRTVHIEPWETAIAEARLEFTWTPLPVFQAYSAYTPGLDRLNAERLAGPDAPSRILWMTPAKQPLSIDGRGLWFDAPLTKVEMLCRYLPLSAEETWQVLVRVADRCATPIPIATLVTRAGDLATLPTGLPPGIVTIAISGVASDPLSRLQILVDHGASWSVSDGQADLRIPLGTASEPNVIGSTTDTGYRGALSLLPPPSTVTIGPRLGAPGVGTQLTIKVAVIPLTDPP